MNSQTTFMDSVHDARVDMFAEEFSNKYETNVGELGSALSGGQVRLLNWHIIIIVIIQC